jgi:5-methylcytosine-specific restriction endonuclease McrA
LVKLQDALNSSKNTRLNTFDWFVLRQKILIRDDKTCVLCGKKDCLEVDHILPISLGGSNKLENLQTLCDVCHKKKTKQDVELLRRTNKLKKYKKSLRRFD